MLDEDAWHNFLTNFFVVPLFLKTDVIFVLRCLLQTAIFVQVQSLLRKCPVLAIGLDTLMRYLDEVSRDEGQGSQLLKNQKTRPRERTFFKQNHDKYSDEVLMSHYDF